MSSSYLKDLFDPKEFHLHVVRAVRFLRPRIDEFDAIAFRGYSGAMIAPTIAMRLKKPVILVRKGEGSHSCYPVEYHNAIGSRYLIIDDRIATGNTIKAIIKGVQGMLGPKAKCVGIYLWHHEKIWCDYNPPVWNKEIEDTFPRKDLTKP